MVQNFVNNLLRRNQGTGVNIQPVLIDEYGNYDPFASANAELNLKQNTTPLTLKDRLFGREMTQDYQKINPETNQVEMATLTNHKPGLLNDMASGFRENYTQGLRTENLMPNQNKGWGTRLGEGLGTVARFADSPLGRGLIAYGLSNYVGDTNPLEQAITAGVGRQNNKARDKAYRQNLIQMGFTSEEINSIPGIVSDDIYKNLIDSKQLQEQQKYREMYLSNQQEQNRIMNQYRQDQLDETRAQRAYDRMLAGQKLSIDEKKLALDWEKFQNDKDNKSNITNDSQIVINQLDELMKLHSQLPQYNTPKGTKKAVSLATGGLSDLGLRPDNIAAYEGVQNMMTNLVARKLAGEKGVMTDKDFDRAKKMIPNIYDTPQQAQAKYNALKTLYYANPNNVVTNNIMTQPTGGTQIGKYKVRVK